MTLKLRILGGLILAAGIASAVPLCQSTGTYADLMAVGACSINDKLFSGFHYMPTVTGGATPVQAEDFAYQVVDAGSMAIGFDFSFALAALPGQSNDIRLSFNIQSLAGATITSNHLVMTGFAVGNAVASVAETYCLDATLMTCPPGSSGSLSTVNGLGGSLNQLVDAATFSGVSLLSVTKDINATAGEGGFATISGVTETVDQSDQNVPEPVNFLLIGSGLTLLGWLGGRRRR